MGRGFEYRCMDFTKGNNSNNAGYKSISKLMKKWPRIIQLHGGKDVYAVRYWRWWDVQFPDNYPLNGLKPVLIDSEEIIKASIGAAFNEGDWVRSSLLVKFIDNYQFVTKNSVFLLVGSGQRLLYSAKTSDDLNAPNHGPGCVKMPGSVDPDAGTAAQLHRGG